MGTLTNSNAREHAEHRNSQRSVGGGGGGDDARSTASGDDARTGRAGDTGPDEIDMKSKNGARNAREARVREVNMMIHEIFVAVCVETKVD